MDNLPAPDGTLAAILVGWTTVPDRETALAIAHRAVESGLAACVQISQPILSVYRWEGKLCEEEEIRVTFKLTTATEPQLRALLVALHPYQTPQWLAAPISHALPEYAAWLRS